MRSSMSLSSAMTQLLSGAKLRMPPRSSSPEQSVIKFKSSPYRPRSEGPEKLLNLRYRPNPSGDVILIFSPHRLSLHFWEMQGEFDEMQEEANAARLKALRSQKLGWVSPYSRSRETILA